MSKTRNNHFVPQWYQAGFSSAAGRMCYLDLTPDPISLPDGSTKILNVVRSFSTSQCFYKTDLYSTFFDSYINDEIERKLFGEIDDSGSKAVRAFISEDKAAWHNNFSNFFIYMDAQKIRTEKGLDWIKSRYSHLDQNQLMMEMQGVRNMHCTIWTEGIREIVSAKNSGTKFIISDHPVTVYNYACAPGDAGCIYPHDPAILLKASQTIFPLDRDHCLILTNYEYAKNPDLADPMDKRAFAKYNRNSLARTDALIRTRYFDDDSVRKINYIIKKRARRFIAAGEKEWLYPEKDMHAGWAEIRTCLLPPQNELWGFGGETFVGYKDGGTYYQDAFGRTKPENTFLRKPKLEVLPAADDACGCGSGKDYGDCCSGKKEADRPSWAYRSIRERNMALYNRICDLTGLGQGKTWDDVRRELSDEHVKKIYEFHAFLWPAETDILGLLPKPDGTLRAVYSGIIDPRVISTFATGSTLYFEEVLIQSPFLNPNVIRPEFNPVNNPQKYRQQTLKDIAFLSALSPYIDAGYINLIPDLFSFDAHLRDQVFGMAEQRTQDLNINRDHGRVMERLNKEDLERILWSLPKERQEASVRRAMPNLSDSEVNEIVDHIEAKVKSDPYALMQDDLYEKDGGQLLSLSLAPNFEMALYICQLTGSLLLTDSRYRWDEIVKTQSLDGPSTASKWYHIEKALGAKEFYFNRNPYAVFEKRSGDKLSAVRNVFKDIYNAAQRFALGEPLQDKLSDLKKELEMAFTAAPEEAEASDFVFKAKFSCIIPERGIVETNVQRLLVSSGSENYLKSVPMAILVEHASN